jgi:hypothetical protein
MVSFFGDQLRRVLGQLAVDNAIVRGRSLSTGTQRFSPMPSGPLGDEFLPPMDNSEAFYDIAAWQQEVDNFRRLSMAPMSG